MNDSKNVYGTSKMALAMRLYEMMIDDCAVNLEEYSVERFAECFMEVLQDYGLFLKAGVIM